MAYVEVPNANLAAGKPWRSTDAVQMNDNIIANKASITELEREYFVTDQDIRDHFTCLLGTPGGISGKWVQNTGGVGTLSIIAEHSLECDNVAAGAGDYAHVTAGTAYQRIHRAEEYVAYMNIRVKRTGTANEWATFGWNDIGLVLASAAPVNDTTDFVGVVFSAGVGWVATCSIGGVSTTYNIVANPLNWHILRLEFTCSAVAGNRKLDIYEDGVLESTITSNFPNVYLRPTIGVSGNTVNISTIAVDFVDFGFMTTPTAA